MALIHCPECGREVSDLAAACVHCGYPLRTAGIPARYALILEDAGPNPQAPHPDPGGGPPSH